jgi:hypothetical protein
VVGWDETEWERRWNGMRRDGKIWGWARMGWDEMCGACWEDTSSGKYKSSGVKVWVRSQWRFVGDMYSMTLVCNRWEEGGIRKSWRVGDIRGNKAEVIGWVKLYGKTGMCEIGIEKL